MQTMKPVKGALGQPTPKGGGGFNAFAAGKKVYGQGTFAPTTGKVSAAGKRGYAARGNRAATHAKILGQLAKGGRF